VPVQVKHATTLAEVLNVKMAMWAVHLSAGPQSVPHRHSPLPIKVSSGRGAKLVEFWNDTGGLITKAPQPEALLIDTVLASSTVPAALLICHKGDFSLFPG
jgi:hypothetical protein